MQISYQFYQVTNIKRKKSIISIYINFFLHINMYINYLYHGIFVYCAEKDGRYDHPPVLKNLNE